MMITQNLVVCSFLILSLHLFQTLSDADNNSYPLHRGDPKYELVCENNVAFVYLNSHKYHVKEINYEGYTIRLADVSVNSSSCSVPLSSQLFDDSDADTLFRPYSLQSVFITFMSCQDPWNRSSLLIPLSDCNNSSHGRGRHAYMMVGRYMNYLDIPYACRVDFLVPTSWNIIDSLNTEIHQSLLDGFEVYVATADMVVLMIAMAYLFAANTIHIFITSGIT